MGTRSISQLDALGSQAPTGVIAALPAEARTARRLERIGWQVTAAGVGVERMRAAVTALLDNGAERLLVWGTAGALHPELYPGALVVPGHVLDTEGNQYTVSAEWQAQLRACVPSGVMTSSGALITAPRPVPDREAKTSLALQTGAVAVDMESAAVARLAAARGVPFAVLRAIVDPLAQVLPPVVSAAAAGRHPASGVVLRLAVSPRDLPGVVALGRNMRIARRNLVVTAHRLAESAN